VSRTHVGAIQAAAAAAGVACTAVVGHGDVSEAILAATREHGIDTIVMAGPGTRSLSAMLVGLTVLFLGSVTTRVVAASPVPVLIVK
jgi:nucleotide-binding universal stress UspA family protein